MNSVSAWCEYKLFYYGSSTEEIMMYVQQNLDIIVKWLTGKQADSV